MFQTTVVEKITTHILWPITFFPKVVPFVRRCKIYGRTRQATDDSVIQRMRFAYWITRATNTHLQYVILIAFSTVTMGARTSFIVTSIHTVHCQS